MHSWNPRRSDSLEPITCSDRCPRRRCALDAQPPALRLARGNNALWIFIYLDYAFSRPAVLATHTLNVYGLSFSIEVIELGGRCSVGLGERIVFLSETVNSAAYPKL